LSSSSSSAAAQAAGGLGALDLVFPAPLSQTVDAAAGRAVVDSLNFLAQSVGFSSDVLDAALARYTSQAMLFPFAADPVPVPGPGDAPLVTGLLVNVTTGDERLRLRTDESYSLQTRVGDGSAIVITAASCFGALRALETLTQVLVFNASARLYSVAATNITDAPRFPYRGVMIDTARAYLHPSSIKVVVDLAAYSKMNVLHLHLTDDQSWPLELESYPLLAQRNAFQNGSAHTYTAADLRDIVAYARARGVRVIPEFDTPAHFSPLFNSYPEFAAIFFPPWQPDNTSALCLVDPSNPGLIDFIATIWTEIASIFPDEALFIGGDEFWDCYQVGNRRDDRPSLDPPTRLTDPCPLLPRAVRACGSRLGARDAAAAERQRGRVQLVRPQRRQRHRARAAWALGDGVGRH